MGGVLGWVGMLLTLSCSTIINSRSYAAVGVGGAAVEEEMAQEDVRAEVKENSLAAASSFVDSFFINTTTSSTVARDSVVQSTLQAIEQLAM